MRAPPDQVRHPVTGDPLELRRGWPRRDGRVELEYANADATTVAASWWPDSAHRVTFHPRGDDTKLPALAAQLAAEDTTLVTHRPGRRAMVRLAASDAARYVKVVRPGKSAEIAEKAAVVARAAGDAFAVPRLVDHDPVAGLLVWSEVPGVTLHERGTDAEWPAGQVATTWARAGLAVRALHRAREPVDVTHDAAAEVSTVRRWLEPAISYGLLPSVQFEERLSQLLTNHSSERALLHRDLHDKQLILLPDERIGLIDVDTVALGEPALDIANVLVHLELRVLQGLLTKRQATTAEQAFMRGIAPSEETTHRIAPYASATRLRLAGVYAFRPRWRGVAAQMLDRALS